MDKITRPHICDIIASYHVMTNIENKGNVYAVEMLRTTTFSRIDTFMAMRVWWQWKYWQKDKESKELKWFEMMVEIYSLLQGDIYIYGSINQFKIKDCGPKKLGGQY